MQFSIIFILVLLFANSSVMVRKHKPHYASRFLLSIYNGFVSFILFCSRHLFLSDSNKKWQDSGEETSTATKVRQHTKKISHLKRKIKTWEENFEAENGFKWNSVNARWDVAEDIEIDR